MGKGKLERFAENLTFNNILQPEYKDIFPNYYLKGKWAKEVFNNNNPIVLELACGKGEYTLALAEKNPNINYMGLDVKGARMWRGAKIAFESGLKNVAFLRIQIDQISCCFDKNEISEIWITFPDPHPRKSRARRRLTSQNFLNKYKNLLIKDACINLKTDSKLLYDYTLEVIQINNHKLIENIEDIYKSDSLPEILKVKTFYENMFLKDELPIYYLKFSI